MKKVSWKVVVAVNCLFVLFILSFFSGWMIKEKKGKIAPKPLETFLIKVVEPNYIDTYGIDLESRMVYNIALLNQVVNRQGQAIDMLDKKVGGFEMKDPNK